MEVGIVWTGSLALAARANSAAAAAAGINFPPEREIDSALILAAYRSFQSCVRLQLGCWIFGVDGKRPLKLQFQPRNPEGH